jgi:hypothetical protein
MDNVQKRNICIDVIHLDSQFLAFYWTSQIIMATIFKSSTTGPYPEQDKVN